jgi:hypothetical protein
MYIQARTNGRDMASWLCFTQSKSTSNKPYALVTLSTMLLPPFGGGVVAAFTAESLSAVQTGGVIRHRSNDGREITHDNVS